MTLLLDILAWIGMVVMTTMGAFAIISTIALTFGRPAVTIVREDA